jgi:hypothetical protein
MSWRDLVIEMNKAFRFDGDNLVCLFGVENINCSVAIDADSFFILIGIECNVKKKHSMIDFWQRKSIG